MNTRVHPVLVTLVVLVVVVVVALVYTRRTEMPKPVTSSGGTEMGSMQGGRRGGGAGRAGGAGRGGGAGRAGGAGEAGRAGGGGARGGGPGGGPGGGMTDPELKITFGPSQSPMGFKIEKMDDASPLKIMGVQQGDIITSVNKQKSSMKAALSSAIQALQSAGTPIELTIDRGGKTQTIKWAKKLPAESAPAMPQGPAAGGGRRGG